MKTHWIDGMSERSTVASGCKLQFLFKSVTANWSDYVGLLLPTVGLFLRGFCLELRQKANHFGIAVVDASSSVE